MVKTKKQKKTTNKKKQTKGKKNNKNKKKCVATFCRKLSALTRRNMERMNMTEEEIKSGVKLDFDNCRKNYCNQGCRGSKNILSRNPDPKTMETLKSLGALSSCQPFNTPFIQGSPEEMQKGWHILNDFP